MKKTLIPILLFVFLSFLPAQESIVTSDLLFWGGIGLKKEVNKWLDFKIEHEWRFEHNVSTLYRKQTYIGFSFDLPKGFKTGVALKSKRDKNKEGIFKDKYAYVFDGRYKYKLDLLSVSYRFRTELNGDDFIDFKDPENGIDLRNRIKIEYNLDPLNMQPYISYEVFLEKEDADAQFLLNNNWFTFGLEYKLSKHNEFDLFYRIDRELTQYYPYTNYCIGLMWQYEI